MDSFECPVCETDQPLEGSRLVKLAAYHHDVLSVCIGCYEARPDMVVTVCQLDGVDEESKEE
jgi:hypothetical protein